MSSAPLDILVPAGRRDDVEPTCGASVHI